ncbi:hypothetical protein FisN_18Lh166 [Fistulifera solaris]|uniref:Major facilitator superfamily (MFS) profile domain-containing protein n=1 Tax=Fistulifera solaris TaxID=1519565 RepID=A0A1Z5JUU2_FISSO|nr:hypothetical protein FisN_18Lh166 [Fistulifera solaris]|eukprot:GAX17521.1 hypothetical protein FisN_18Lh166 [Fistulifera solaris]
MNVSIDDGPRNVEMVEEGDSVKKIPWYKFDNVTMSRGYCTLGIGRGALVMSNIFLSTSLILLASEEAGCLNEERDEVVDDCDKKVYGFKPISLISNIAIMTGVLSALFMPLAGAMIDYTSFRRQVGICVAVLMILIQAVQIYTVSSTWFPMAMLQALAGFLYQVQVLAVYAYLPEIATTVGQQIMTQQTALFTMTQFGAQCLFLIVVIAISIASGLDDVNTAQVSQGIDVVWTGSFFYWGWRLLPNVPPRHVLPEGRLLLTEGFSRVYHTAKEIQQHYKRGLRCYFAALIFAESAVNAFTTVAVVFLDEQIGLSGTEIGLFFLVTLLFSLPGSKIGAFVTAQTNPNTSWQLCMLSLMLFASGGAILLDYIPKSLSYLWGAGIGLYLGWFYPTENLFFSMILPKDHEAELAGFYVYCTQILSWLPPLIFTILVEADVNQTYAVVAVSSFLLISILSLQCAAPWDDILEESGRSAAKRIEE